MAEPHTEQVLGISRALVPGGLSWRGVRGADLAPYLDSVRENGEFRVRAEAETDPTWKQVIPYLLLRDGDRIFLMRRTKAGGDARLHDLYSIGVGGHVNPEDGDVMGGLSREWAEEIDADFEPDFQPLGVLNDDDTPVGAVHLGLVYVADAGGRPVAIRETHKLEGAFASIDECAAVKDLMEGWSALLFDFVTGHTEGG
jgi:predicted NUDIX family phosphoesterase